MCEIRKAKGRCVRWLSFLPVLGLIKVGLNCLRSYLNGVTSVSCDARWQTLILVGCRRVLISEATRCDEHDEHLLTGLVSMLECIWVGSCVLTDSFPLAVHVVLLPMPALYLSNARSLASL